MSGNDRFDDITCMKWVREVLCFGFGARKAELIH